MGISVPRDLACRPIAGRPYPWGQWARPVGHDRPFSPCRCARGGRAPASLVLPVYVSCRQVASKGGVKASKFDLRTFECLLPINKNSCLLCWPPRQPDKCSPGSKATFKGFIFTHFKINSMWHSASTIVRCTDLVCILVFEALGVVRFV